LLKVKIIEVTVHGTHVTHQDAYSFTHHAMGRFTFILWYACYSLVKTLLWLWNVELQ